MTRGLPDWGVQQYQKAAVTMDLSQLFLGLTGCQSYYNTGRLIWLDTFHCGLGAWMMSKDGDGSYPLITKAECYISGGALSLPVGTLATLGSSRSFHRIIYPNLDRVGLETIWIVGSVRTLNYTAGLEYSYNGVNSWYGLLTYNSPAGAIKIRTGGTDVQIGTLGSSLYGNLWMPVKLVVDLTTGMYVRCYVGNKAYNLSTYPLNPYSQKVQASLTISISGYAASATTYLGSVGYVALTTDEP